MVSDVHHLVSSGDIAGMLSVSRQRVQQLIKRPDFPQPEAVPHSGKVWLRSAIEEWARANGRTLSNDA